MFLFAFFLTSTVSGQEFELSVNITGVNQSLKGNLMVGIFSSDHSFKHKTNPAFERAIEVNDSTESCTFKNIPVGFYAIAIYHDENGDDTLNTKKLGIPIEGVGFSGTKKSKLKPPNFEEAGFNFSKDTIVNIVIKYPKNTQESY